MIQLFALIIRGAALVVLLMLCVIALRLLSTL